MNFSKNIIKWYGQNKRDLPWRRTKDPYLIWLSEIILQQTRVDQGLSYYQRFAAKYPTIFHLSKATENEVLKLWQGLGYYSRARNMHATAKLVVKEEKGVFPDSYLKLTKLKGIGEYTASAIASFAFKMSYPVVDGNVIRVLSRFYGIKTLSDTATGKKLIYEKALKLIDHKHPDLFNQAIMEMGALICKPQNPLCKHCVLCKECFAFEHNMIAELPIKKKKNKIKTRYFYYLMISPKEKPDNIYIKKRTENDIWKNLYDFPLIESPVSLKPEKLINSHQWNSYFKNKNAQIRKKSKAIRHVLSHQIILAVFIHVCSEKIEKQEAKKLTLINKKELHKYPIPRLLEEYLFSTKK